MKKDIEYLLETLTHVDDICEDIKENHKGSHRCYLVQVETKHFSLTNTYIEETHPELNLDIVHSNKSVTIFVLYMKNDLNYEQLEMIKNNMPHNLHRMIS